LLYIRSPHATPRVAGAPRAATDGHQPASMGITETMANREELGIIRRARAGQAGAQLALGKLYLSGGAGLPESLPTALHWLERAARQDCAEACELIGAHIPFALARHSAHALAPCYERAYDNGVPGAGLVLAQLLFAQAPEASAPASRAKARRALSSAAAAGSVDARHLLAQWPHGAPEAMPPAPRAAASTPGARPSGLPAPTADGADPGAAVLLEQAWRDGAARTYLQRALPLARALLAAGADGVTAKSAPPMTPDEARLLARCAQLLDAADPAHPAQAEARRMRELAAAGHDPHAQLALGLWCARMRQDGSRTEVGSGAANFKKAIRWLQLAGEQGLAAAWYALARIYLKPECSQRNVHDAQRCLERAAEMGHRDAQCDCGNAAWRARRDGEQDDVRALYWLDKAATQGCARALAMLGKVAPRTPVAPDLARLAPGVSQPLLQARLELAALFGLSRAEALLLDVRGADHGHCLVIDIRASYGRGKRRLVRIETVQERQALDRIVRRFELVDGGPDGPEGNYRQRLYRLKTALAAEASAAGT
jgi:TPR repeat protein